MAERSPQPVADTFFPAEPPDGTGYAPPDPQVESVVNEIRGYQDRLSPAVGVIIEVPDLMSAGSVPWVAVVAVACRCVQRVVPLVDSHPELGPLVRRAVRTGTDRCVGVQRDSASIKEDWFALAATFGRAINAQPFNLERMAGPGLATLASLSFLGVVSKSAYASPKALCEDVIHFAGAAVWASSTRAVRLRFNELDQFRDAVQRDVEQLKRFGVGNEQLLVDPGESGPFGPLWEGDPPADLRPRVLIESPDSEGLTSEDASPTLADVPDPSSPAPTLQPPAPDAETGPSELGAINLPPPPATPRRGRRGPTDTKREEARTKQEALAEFRRRLTGSLEAYREEFTASVLPLLQSQSFYEDNKAVVAELNAIMQLLGMSLRDPNDEAVPVSVTCLGVPGTLGGNVVVRTRANEGKPRETLSARTSFPDQLVAQIDYLFS